MDAGSCGLMTMLIPLYSCGFCGCLLDWFSMAYCVHGSRSSAGSGQLGSRRLVGAVPARHQEQLNSLHACARDERFAVLKPSSIPIARHSPNRTDELRSRSEQIEHLKLMVEKLPRM